ncbi:hypothetical protein CHLRE_03g181550v5 [Chlamydomonas reinhardtii]|uniref:Uncharacterized protein n=1 Tax=Chlamydomonas reinhardtii TaxID=3055 RepID=A0A2K3DXR4_CHLRE|nr:uncharacterized protein CHLRE_03g181550v5 [Chlamydomonas reinhardtii]PNW85334.1 hypothetical protein CHLRE_03g181550v5 [Chlamydomonas reinhardtii]
MAKELGPEGCSARAAAAAETLGPEGCSARSVKALETMGAGGRSARSAASWKKRGKPVVAAHTPRQGGGCAKCGATKTLGRGLCNRCYKREWRKTK